MIPLLEREERAMRDARAGLEGTQGPDSGAGTQAVSTDGSSDALDRTNG